MEIIGMKNGTTRPRNNSTIVQKAGDAVLIDALSKDRLELEMERIKVGPSIEELANKKLKADERYARINAKYNSWLKEDHKAEYVNHTPITDNHVIIKLFFYNELPSNNIIILDENSDAYHRVYPVAIVVASSSPKVDPGDVVTIPAVYGKTVQSKEWVQYQKDVREQPTLKQVMPEPPAYVGKLSEWTQYIYQKDPFTDTSLEDQHVFCIADRYLQTIKK